MKKEKPLTKKERDEKRKKRKEKSSKTQAQKYRVYPNGFALLFPIFYIILGYFDFKSHFEEKWFCPRNV